MIQLKLLYAIITQNDVETLIRVKNDFLSPDNLKIFQFVRTFHATQKTFPEIATVESEFNIILEETNDKASFWLQKVISKYRELLVEEAVKDAIRTKGIEAFQKAIERYHSADVNSSVTTYGKDTQSIEDAYDLRKANGGITYLSTGDDNLDQGMFGISKADFWVLGGAEGKGKTFWILRLANSIRKTVLTSPAAGRPILFINGEMTDTDLMERLVCIDGQISYRRLNLGGFTNQEERKFREYLKKLRGRFKLGKEHLGIVNDCMNTTDVERYIKLYNPAVVFVDGIHLLANSFDWKDLMQASKELKALTRRYLVPIIAVVHIKTKEGKNEKDVSVDSFAYYKAARDADIAGVFFQDDLMESEDQLGLKFVKGRKGQALTIIYQNDREITGQYTISVDGLI